MKKIYSNRQNLIDLESPEFGTFLDKLHAEGNLIQYNYYYYLFGYTTLGTNNKDKYAAYKALTKMLKSEQILSDLLISEQEFDISFLYDTAYNNWYDYDGYGIWAPCLTISDSLLFESIETMFPQEVFSEFKMSKLASVRKALSIKLGKDLSKIKSENVLYNLKVYDVENSRIDQYIYLDKDTDVLYGFSTTGERIYLSSLVAEPQPNMYLVKHFLDDSNYVKKTYITRTLKKQDFNK